MASWRSMTKIAGSGSASGSISQRHGSADPDPDPDPHQNVMDPQHWERVYLSSQQELRYIATLYVMVIGWEGWACTTQPHQPMMGCTPEIGNRHSVCTLWSGPPNIYILLIRILRTLILKIEHTWQTFIFPYVVKISLKIEISKLSKKFCLKIWFYSRFGSGNRSGSG